MKIKILLRSYNDFDQILPVVDYLKKYTDHNLEIHKSSSVIDNCTDHLNYLKNKYNIKVVDFYDVHFNKKDLKKIFLYKDIEKFVYKILKPFFWGDLIARYFCTRLQKLFEKIIKKNILNHFDKSTIFLLDTGNEQTYPLNIIIKHINSICFAHGYSVYVNLDCSRKKILNNRLLKDRIKIFLNNYKRRPYSNKYITAPLQRDTYFKSSLSPEFYAIDKVKEIGAPRFTKEWCKELSKLYKNIQFSYGDSNKTNIVLFVSHFSYNVNEQSFYDLFKTMNECENINFVFKPHTRGNLYGVEEDRISGFNAQDIPSFVLSRWADIGILFGSSIGLQLLNDKTPILLPNYIDSNQTIYEKYNLCKVVHSNEELKKMVRMKKESLEKIRSDKDIGNFLKKFVYGGKNYQDMMSSFIKEIADN